MLPFVNIGDLTISVYWTMYAVGLISMLVWVLIRRRLYDLAIWKCIIFFLYLTILGTLGAKLLAIIEAWLKKTVTGDEIDIGFSYYGAVFLIYGVIALCSKPLSLTSEKGRDLAAVCVMSQAAFMRVGCFFNGCCGGWLCSIGQTSFHWPTQAIESICDFLIIAWLLDCENKNKGKLYPRFMLAYGSIRFFLEFLRDTEKIYLHMSDGQWCSLIAICLAVIALRVGKRRGKDNG